MLKEREPSLTADPKPKVLEAADQLREPRNKKATLIMMALLSTLPIFPRKSRMRISMMSSEGSVRSASAQSSSILSAGTYKLSFFQASGTNATSS